MRKIKTYLILIEFALLRSLYIRSDLQRDVQLCSLLSDGRSTGNTKRQSNSYLDITNCQHNCYFVDTLKVEADVRSSFPINHFLIPAADGHNLALWRVSENVGPAVILTHGTFSNQRSCRGLAEHLATRGFSPWILEWRGHGASERPRNHAFTLEDVARFDLPAAFEAVQHAAGQERVFLIGHSGGGLAACMWIAKNPAEARQRLRGLVLMAAQATHAAPGFRQRILLQLINGYLSGRKTAPGHRIGIGPEAESARLMQQWCTWNLLREFRGRDGFGFIEALGHVDLPVLALAGAGDWFIAPPEGCEALASAFGSRDTTFYRCGKSDGFSEDYSHARLIISQPASREIWPLVEKWLSESGRNLKACSKCFS
ncbi:alpha/beta fold hydrolase [Paraburkholderia mimosarum]|uniref:alpha/beta fold hydrolase n=1 Tax=Paraburkholderia mimosarum TaxID=312026 RepID=UPI0039C03E3A